MNETNDHDHMQPRPQSQPIGVIFGTSSTIELKVAVTNPLVKKGGYLVADHEIHGHVLCQIIDIETQSNLTFDQACRISEGEKIDIEEKCAAVVSIIGYRDERGLVHLPQTPLGVGQFVYAATQNDIESVLGLQNVPALGAYIGLLKDFELKVYLDINHLVQRHFSVIARTGSGKSYTVGVLVEELLKHEVPTVIIDPHGEYNALMHPNIDVDPSRVRKFGIHPRGYAEQIIEYVLDKDAEVKGIGQLVPLTFEERNLDLEDLIELTGLRTSGTLIGILSRAVSDLKAFAPYYYLEDIIETVALDRSSMKWNIVHALEHVQNLGIFARRATPLTNLVRHGQVTIINLKGVPPFIQEVIVSRLASQLFKARKAERIPPMVLIVEEAHKYAPQKGTILSSQPLHTLASEGRKFGLGLGVVSQRPALVDKNILSQCNTQIILKTTNPNDLKAIIASVEGLTTRMTNEIQRLPVGIAIVVGGNILLPIFVEIRVRETKHGGHATTIIEQ